MITDDQIREAINSGQYSESQLRDMALQYGVSGDRIDKVQGWAPGTAAAHARRIEGVTDPGQVAEGVRSGKYGPVYGTQLLQGIGDYSGNTYNNEFNDMYLTAIGQGGRKNSRQRAAFGGTQGVWDALMRGDITAGDAVQNAQARTSKLSMSTPGFGTGKSGTGTLTDYRYAKTLADLPNDLARSLSAKAWTAAGRPPPVREEDALSKFNADLAAPIPGEYKGLLSTYRGGGAGSGGFFSQVPEGFEQYGVSPRGLATGGTGVVPNQAPRPEITDDDIRAALAARDPNTLSQADIAQAAQLGLSPFRIERAMGWPSGTIDAVMGEKGLAIQGQSPLEMPATPFPVNPQPNQQGSPPVGGVQQERLAAPQQTATVTDDQIRDAISSGQYTPGQLIDLAQQNNISPKRIDAAMGWAPGTAAAERDRYSFASTQATPQQQALFDKLWNATGTASDADIRNAINSGALTPQQIFQLAQKHNIAPSRIDKAMGWPAGTAQGWADYLQQQGFGPPGFDPNKGQSSELQPHESVADTLSNLLAANSPFLQAAGTSALQAMEARGLGTSSLAEGAFADAFIRNALPIAQQDAGQAFARGERLGSQSHDVFLQNLGFQQQTKLAEQQFKHATSLLETEYGKRLELLQSEWGSRMDLQRLQNVGALDIETLRQKADTARLSQNTYLAYVNANLGAGTSMLAEIQAINQQQGLTEDQKRAALDAVAANYDPVFSFIDKLFSSAAGWDWSFLPKGT